MSPTGRNKLHRLCRADGGFTLIEVMIVIVIIGLMSSLVLLNLPPSQKSAREQAEELAARLTLASRSAVLSGETVGVSVTSDGYGFLRRRGAGWETFDLVPDKTWLGWEDRTQVRLMVEGERLKLPHHTQAAVPILYFTSTADAPEFKLTLYNGGEEATVSNATSGAILVGKKSDKP